MKVNVSTPSGFPEFSPKQEHIRQEFLSIITKTFELFGASTITTPLVEREENLVAKGGNAKEIYVLKRLLDEDGDKSHSGNALRFDQTVPLALYTARHLNDITFPFKRFVIGPVFRGERAQKGRYRQFYQCDFDILGSEKLSVEADGEAIAVGIQIFENLTNRFDLGDFVFRISNRKILISFFESLGITGDKIKPVMDIVDDFEKMRPEALDEAFAQAGIDASQKDKIYNFINLGGENVDIIKKLEMLNLSTMGQEGIAELATVIKTLNAYGIKPNRWQVELKIVRGLDYYTGTVFECNMMDDRIKGSVCGGGRYDDLASVFTGKKLPGVGFGMGITRLLGQIFDNNMIELGSMSSLQVLFLLHDKDLCFEPAMKLVQELRANGISSDVYKEDRKFKKQFDYADKIGVKYVAVLGEDEIAEQVVMLKNMHTGDQQKIKFEKLLPSIVKGI